jgi:8-oxo-dGTP pyrophosphatase MutT (NUDIX family)
MTSFIDEVRVTRVDRVDRVALRHDASPFEFPQSWRPSIESHWTRRIVELPDLFNGTIHVTTDHRIGTGALTGICRPMAFKDFLYWRDSGRKPEGFVDGFGSAVVRAREGHILLGRASRHTMNAGTAYFIGGFIDTRDRTPGGTIDIDGSIARELQEEAGLDAGALTRAPGYILAEEGRMLSIAIVYRSGETAETLRRNMLAHANTATEQEIEDVVVIRHPSDLDGHKIKPHAAAVARAILQGD